MIVKGSFADTLFLTIFVYLNLKACDFCKNNLYSHLDFLNAKLKQLFSPFGILFDVFNKKNKNKEKFYLNTDLWNNSQLNLIVSLFIDFIYYCFYYRLLFIMLGFPYLI